MPRINYRMADTYIDFIVDIDKWFKLSLKVRQILSNYNSSTTFKSFRLDVINFMRHPIKHTYEYKLIDWKVNKITEENYKLWENIQKHLDGLEKYGSRYCWDKVVRNVKIKKK